MPIGFLSALRCFVEIVWSGYGAALKVVSRTRVQGWRDCLQLCIDLSGILAHELFVFPCIVIYSIIYPKNLLIVLSFFPNL